MGDASTVYHTILLYIVFIYVQIHAAVVVAATASSIDTVVLYDLT